MCTLLVYSIVGQRMSVEQVKKAKNSVLDDICQFTRVSDYSCIRIDNLLAKRSVMKEKLAS